MKTLLMTLCMVVSVAMLRAQSLTAGAAVGAGELQAVAEKLAAQPGIVTARVEGERVVVVVTEYASADLLHSIQANYPVALEKADASRVSGDWLNIGREYAEVPVSQLREKFTAAMSAITDVKVEAGHVWVRVQAGRQAEVLSALGLK